MKTKLLQSNICVMKSLLHGYGVFAEQSFLPGEIIEECYLLTVPPKCLNNYVFGLRDNKVLALGYGSLYNHADFPNAQVELDRIENIAIFSAISPIKKGDEILISYGKNWVLARNISLKKLNPWRKLQYFFRIHSYLLRFAMIVFFLLLINRIYFFA